jgi:DNA-directed RNA polymerase specialized sigma24 family protein
VLQISELSERPGKEEGRDFTDFVLACEPNLRRGLVALYGPERGRDATAEALAYAWEHWRELDHIDNLAGYLFRVAQSRSRERQMSTSFIVPAVDYPDCEPKLPAALRALTDQQRLCVVLVHGFGWRFTEVAEFIGCRPTTVQQHVTRGLRRLRKALGVDSHVE